MSLEQEFKKLMDSVYQQIHDKQAAGDLSFDEAQQLRQMVYNRLQKPTPQRGWNSSGCFVGYSEDWDGQTAPDNYNDDGWSPSMVC